ncbi:GIY-YIG nuclease family protein [Cesiribacter sp. SM1]|uniref:GIY-YIG nuclease family protein n=1 Tax=Cesiribacter sp. SM1 TaxID=2861196 RepID=UPI001CD52048|nr:GIY-YIG nuclease family protein [Cesiribacter sp. SM1]
MAYINYYVYLLSNRSNSVLYTGMTDDLQRRVEEHKNSLHSQSFSSRYKVHKLVWWEEHPTAEEALEREKQLKAGPRAKKVALIEAHNPLWLDLAKDWYK